MYLNIEGLTSHKIELDLIIGKWEPDVVCLAETHVTDSIFDHEIGIDGYRTINAVSHSRYTGGTIIYIREELQSKVFLKKSESQNMMWVTGVEVMIENERFLIFCLYHSPAASHAEFLAYLEDVFEEYCCKKGTLLIIGDYNIDMSKNSFYSEKLKKLISQNGLYQSVSGFTRITNQSSTIIDLLVTNNKNLIPQIHQTPKISDHCIITVDLMINTKKADVVRTYRDYSHFDTLNFQLDLMDTEWNRDSTDVNVLAEQLVGGMMRTLNKYAPKKEKVTKSKWIDKKWWTLDIEMNIKKRDQLYRKAVITKDNGDFTEYKMQRNRVVDLIRRQKTNYYNTKIDMNKNNSKEMWKTIKKLVGGKSCSKHAGIHFGNNIETNGGVIAEKFNIYFVESIELISKKISDQDIEKVIQGMDECGVTMTKFRLLTLTELRDIVKNLKKKNSSVDGITAEILQRAFEVTGDRFLQLINVSLEYGAFPEKWKKSTIVPVEKKPGTDNCEEYRPINMLPVYEKLLEIVVNQQFIKFFEINRLLNMYQAGFRKGNSCESALQTVLMNWKSALSQKKLVAVVFLDFRRAFETVDRRLLLEKLRKYGLRGDVLDWFREYIMNRCQETRYMDNTSSARESQYGVPQGTVLGPGLFIVYINDLAGYLNKCSIQLFADDTLLYIEGDDVETMVRTINSELTLVYEWLLMNGLVVNIQKTKFMVVKSRYNSVETKNHSGVFLNNEKIEQIGEYKYLGIIVDEHLSFSQHAEYITKKISKKKQFTGPNGCISQ